MIAARLLMGEVSLTIQLSIPSVSAELANLEPISALSDEQVLALTELQMELE